MKPNEKPHCGKCTKYCDSYQYSGDIGRREMSLQTSTYGCVTNPGAREYLMADVVKELERLSNLNCHASYKYAMEQAIALIRDGVK